MLGTGRPFAVSLVQCRDARPLGDMDKCTMAIHHAQSDVRVRQLMRLDKADLSALKHGETSELTPFALYFLDKTKSYVALCEVSADLPADILDRLPSTSVDIVQRTPIRVLKRRALLDRPRTIHCIRAVPINERRFMLYLRTQAGTYIKEFVHGDFGRTQPSVGDLLNLPLTTSVDILELDVQHVHLDEWPPSANATTNGD